MSGSNLDIAPNSLSPDHSTDHVSSLRRAVWLGKGMEREEGEARKGGHTQVREPVLYSWAPGPGYG